MRNATGPLDVTKSRSFRLVGCMNPFAGCMTLSQDRWGEQSVGQTEVMLPIICVLYQGLRPLLFCSSISSSSFLSLFFRQKQHLVLLSRIEIFENPINKLLPPSTPTRLPIPTQTQITHFGQTWVLVEAATAATAPPAPDHALAAPAA